MTAPLQIAYFDSVADASKRHLWQDRLTHHLGGQHLGPIELVPLEAAGMAEIALVWKPPHGALARLPHLRLILSLGQGVDHLLEDPALPPTPFIVRLVDADMAHALSHWVILAILDHIRDGPAYRLAAQNRIFAPLPQRMTNTLPIAIYGLGAIGTVCAERLAHLGFDVHGWVRTKRERRDNITHHHGISGFQHMAQHCQIHICLLPLTDQTRGIFNADIFAMMPQNAYFINAGRGGHVVEADLLTAIQSHHLAGACLDVFSTEPLPSDHPFWHEDRVTIWPHVAAQTNPDTAITQVARAIKDYLNGIPPAHHIDRQRGY